MDGILYLQSEISLEIEFQRSAWLRWAFQPRTVCAWDCFQSMCGKVDGQRVAYDNYRDANWLTKI
jgi:hypothetical protein